MKKQKIRTNINTWVDTISARLEDNKILKPPNKIVSYAVAIISSLIVLGIKYQFNIGVQAPYLLFLPAVMFSAFYGGLGAGLLASILTTLFANIFFLPPYYRVNIINNEILLLVTYFIQAVILTIVIDRQKRVWEEVYKQREWFLVTLESIGDAVIATDITGRIVYMNEVAQNITGWKRREAQGKKLAKIFNIINEQTRTSIENPVDKVLEDGKMVVLAKHTLLITKQGNYVPVDDSAAPIRDRDNQIVGVIMVFRDVTEKKKQDAANDFMTEASKLLSSSLDYETSLKSIAQSAVPQIADWCMIHLLDEKGVAQMVTITHTDSKKIRWVKKLQKDYPYNFDSRSGVQNVIHTAKPQFHPVITDFILKKGTRDSTHFKLLKKMELQSMMIVPIILQNKGVGAITFISAESKKRYDEADLKMAEELAARASLAIENSHLYKSAQEERKRLQELVANVPGVVWESWGEPDEKNQRINFVSDYVETMLGYTVEEWLNTPNFWLTIVHPEDKEKAAAEASRTYTSGRIGVNRFRWIAKDGRILWVETQSFVFKDQHGKPLGMRGVTMNITERVEMERRKDEFIGMASHELKTPVTSLKVYAQLMQKQLGNQVNLPMYSFVSKMNNQIDRLTKLINDLLNLSRIQAGKLKFHQESFDINILIKDTAENIQSAYNSHTIEIQGNIPNNVYADHDRIEQVVINLLTNAVRYSPQSKKIIVTLNSYVNEIKIGVQDFGIGIAKEYQNRIFDRFYQVSSSNSHPTSGLGIGLYITNEIVKRHSGRLWVESEVGKGSVFYFTLPVTKKISDD